MYTEDTLKIQSCRADVTYNYVICVCINNCSYKTKITVLLHHRNGMCKLMHIECIYVTIVQAMRP